MKFFTSFFLAAAIFAGVLQSPAFAGESKLASGAQKVGQAIVWPFKKLGEGMKAAGSGAKNAISRKK